MLSDKFDQYFGDKIDISNIKEICANRTKEESWLLIYVYCLAKGMPKGSLFVVPDGYYRSEDAVR